MLALVALYVLLAVISVLVAFWPIEVVVFSGLLWRRRFTRQFSAERVAAPARELVEY